MTADPALPVSSPAGLTAPLLAGLEGAGEAGASGQPLTGAWDDAALALGSPSSSGLACEDFLELSLPLRQSSLRAACMNLMNATLGAGMFALPRTFAGLGLAGGSGMVLLVALCTFLSLDVLLRAAAQLRETTYVGAMRRAYGGGGSAAARGAIVLGSFGFLVLYLIVLADVLLGSAEYSGILPDLWPDLPLGAWYLSRPAVLAWMTLAVAPALAPTTLAGVAVVSGVSVACSVTVTAGLVLLAAAAASQGKLEPTRWLPDPTSFGDSGWEAAAGLLTVVPVVMTAFVCHYSVMPIQADLVRPTPRRMRRVLGTGLAACGGVYIATGAAGYAVFGSGVAGDVLANMDFDQVAPILGGSERATLAFVVTVKVAVALAMLSSFPITLWPMRADLLDLIGQGLGAQAGLSHAAFYLVTYVSLALVFLSALAISSAYSMVSLVGSTSALLLAFLFPGLLAWRAAGAWRGVGALLVALWAVLVAAGVLSATLWRGDAPAAAAAAAAAAA